MDGKELLGRRAVIESARDWIGTPFHDKAAIKGAGVDCGYFPYAVYKECGLLPADFVMPDYSPQFWCHRGEEIYVDGLLRAGFIEVKTPQPADVIISKYGRVFSHGAIILDWPKIIHASPDGKRVKYDSAEVYRLYAGAIPKKFFSHFS